MESNNSDRTLLLDIRGKDERIAGMPLRLGRAQGLSFVPLRRIPLLVVNGPFLSSYVLGTVAGAKLTGSGLDANGLPGRGKAIFVHTITLAASNTAAQDNAYLYVNGVIDGAAAPLLITGIVPSVAGIANISAVLDVQVDENTALVAYTSTANFTNHHVFATYAIVQSSGPE